MRSIVRSLAVEMALQQRATGRRIAQLRERAHLTQEAAADRAGVTLRAFQKWEAGGGIQYSNLQRLAEALRTSVEEITGEAETPSPFKVSDQLDQIVGEFNGRVDDVEDRLAQMDAKLDALLRGLAAAGVPAPPGELARRAKGSPTTPPTGKPRRRRAAQAARRDTA